MRNSSSAGTVLSVVRAIRWITCLLALSLASHTFAATTFNAVAAGDVTTNDVVLWTRAVDVALLPNAPSIPLTLQIATDASFSVAAIAVTSSGNTVVAEDYTFKIVVGGLTAGTRYYYRFKDAGSTFSNTGTFRTAPTATAKAPVRFGFSGDCDGQWRPYGSVSGLNQLGLDFFCFLGDTIYETSSAGNSPSAVVTAPDSGASTQTLIDLRRKYLENISITTNGNFAGLRNFFSGQANYTLLDNHEVCSNIPAANPKKSQGAFQAGGAPGAGLPASYDSTNSANDINLAGPYTNKTGGFLACIRAYSNYMPIRETTVSAPNDSRTNGTQKMYLSQQWGKNLIYIHTDCRSYRDMRLYTAASADDTGPRADNPKRTMLGATQLAWVKQTLLTAQAAGTPWKFVSVSDPMDQRAPVGGSLTSSISSVADQADGGKSWIGGYRAERNDLLKFIADNKITNVVFLATDDHMVRTNELQYFPDPVNAPTVQVPVPTCISVITGPMGAKTDGYANGTSHAFTFTKSLADDIATKQSAAGINPIGLDPAFPGLHNVVREGDPNADTLRQPVDFYSPDTFNYTTFDISADGRTLTVGTYGIDFYAPNTYPDPSNSGPVRLIMGFQLDAQDTPSAAISVSSGPYVAPATVGFDGSASIGGATFGTSIVSYIWNFGDGTEGSGAKPSHQYTLPGTYTVTLSIVNSVGVKSAAATVTITVVGAPTAAGAADTDGDGFTDAVELAAGTSPTNAKDTPTGKPLAETLPLPEVRLGIKLNFAKPTNNDSIQLIGQLLLKDGFSVNGAKLVIDVGGVAKSFTLDAAGSLKSGGDSVSVKSKGTGARIGKLTLKRSKGTFAATLSTVGLTNSDASKDVNVPLMVVFNGEVYSKSQAQSYKAKSGKIGATKDKK